MRREAVLSAVRAALAGVVVPPLAAAPPAPGADDTAALATRFVAEARAVGTIVHEVASRADAGAVVAAIVAGAAPAPRVVAWSTPLARELATSATALLLHAALDVVDRATSPDVIAAADVGVTEADVVVAASGTLVLRACGRARSVSLLPATHIAVVERARLAADLAEALRRLRAVDDPESAVTLITGPSRTADIEKKLVVGVHGPCALHVVLLGESGA